MRTENSEPASTWQDLKQRLTAFEQRIEAGFERTPEERMARLALRTRDLARPEAEAETTDWLDVLVFALDEEIYALEAVHVAEAVPLKLFTPLPGTPPFVLGIVNVHGRIVSVLDLRVFFEIPKRGLSDLNYLVVLRGPDMEFGLLTDRLLGLHRIDAGNLQTELPNLTGIRAAYLRGVTRAQWTVLDGAKLLADPALRIEYRA